MQPPDFEEAIIPVEKLRDYLLNVSHVDGGSKARLLNSIGFEDSRPDELERAIREQATICDAETGRPSPFGVKYEAVAPIFGPLGSIWVRTIWIVLHQETTARFVTLVPEDKP